jgi:hypothetical protein
MKLKIEKGVPVPAKHESWASIVERMEIGDSVLAPDAETIKCLKRAINRVGFSSQTQREDKGIRIWKLNSK